MKRSIPASLALVGFASACAFAIACSQAPISPDDGDNPTPQSPDPPATTVLEADADVPDSSSASCTTVPPNNKCGLDPQCGCGNNETCDVTNTMSGATSCVTAGSATVGRPCNGTGDCLMGLACVYGACRPYCTTPLSTCTVTGTDLCVKTQDDVTGNDVPNRNVCTITCDPREPSAVCGTNSCLWFDTVYAPAKVSGCNFAGTTPPLTTCTDSQDCVPGYACVDHPSKSIGFECEQWCRIGVKGDCDSGFDCNDVYGANAPVIGGVKEGICQDKNP